jgi:hypothetical protein
MSELRQTDRGDCRPVRILSQTSGPGQRRTKDDEARPWRQRGRDLAWGQTSTLPRVRRPAAVDQPRCNVFSTTARPQPQEARIPQIAVGVFFCALGFTLLKQKRTAKVGVKAKRLKAG